MIHSNLSLGCHNLTGGSSYRRSARIVHCALDLGIRRFDVAPSYGLGTAEATLATALGPHRFDPAIEITTKYGSLPPRYGWLAAWIREPYRAIRRLRSGGWAPKLVEPKTGTAATFKVAALDAVEASLRAMRLERIGAYLSHERLSAGLAERFREDMAALLQRGLIAKAGCSGELANVAYMLSKATGVASVAQVSMRHREAAAASASEIRLFNLGAAARALAATWPGPRPLTDTLRNVLPSRDHLDEIGLALAAVLAWGRLHVPKAVLLVNASSAERLSAVINASADAGLSEWVRRYPLIVERQTEHA